MTNYRVFDGHCDTPIELWLQNQPLLENTLAVSLARAQRLGGWAQFFAFCTAWVKAKLPRPEIFSRALDNFHAQLCENEDKITLCRTVSEAETAMQAGKCAAFLAIEGAEAVREDEGLLEHAYESGVRMISLVWNLPNGLAAPCGSDEGLTETGRRFFKRAQALGMLVDVSHLSEKGFWDMIELAEKPVLASHSNSFSVCPHPRNLTDDQFRAICDLGGTAGLNLYVPFLTEQPRASFDDLRRHLDHFLELAGLAREEIYISNVVKIRPTKTGSTGRLSNRPPTKEEIAFFRPWLMAEIARVNPGVIATLGNVPLRALTGDKSTIGDMHGAWHTAVNGLPLFALYHPAAIIYRRELLSVYEQDVCSLRDSLTIQTQK